MRFVPIVVSFRVPEHIGGFDDLLPAFLINMLSDYMNIRPDAV